MKGSLAVGQRKSILDKALNNANVISKTDLDAFKGNRFVKSEELSRQYARYRSNVRLNKNIIFYEVMSGSRMGDNPYGIFKYLLSHPEYGEYLHVWSVAGDATIPEEYEAADNVEFVGRNTAAYAYFLACAQRVICNANLPAFFVRRPNQLYLNTWHGIPYKELGRNTPKARFGSPAGTSTFLKATHVITPCDFMTDQLLSAYSMRGASNATLAELGYPRVDLTVNTTRAERAALREKMGVAKPDVDGKYKPTVLYAPTWREQQEGKGEVDGSRLVSDLQALGELDIQIMYRGHHRMHRILKDNKVGQQIGNVIIPPHEISSNELLTVVDVLITDYSSIFFDFLPTGRPIVHYLYDLNEYRDARGLTMESSELPGAVALSQSELVDSVALAASTVTTAGLDRSFHDKPLQGDGYQQAQLRFCPHEDGHSSDRAAEFFFKRKRGEVPKRTARDGRPTAAFWAGALSKTANYQQFYKGLVESAKSSVEQTVLIIDRKAPIDKDIMKSIKELGDAVSTVSYEKKPTVLLDGEEKAYTRFVDDDDMNPETANTILRRNASLRSIFSYEYRCRLDSAQFDRVTIAEGVSNFELALATLADRRKRLPSGKRVLPKPSDPCASSDLTKKP